MMEGDALGALRLDGAAHYLLPYGDLAIIAIDPSGSDKGFPIQAVGVRGRTEIGFRFRAHQIDSDRIELSIRAAEGMSLPGNSAVSKLAALFIRLCIRRSVSLPVLCAMTPEFAGALRAGNDPIVRDMLPEGRLHVILADSTHIEPRETHCMEALYTHPADIPWNYRPLDYDCLQYVQAEKPKNVLDIGCGVGRNAVALENDGHNVWGVDVSGAAIASAKSFCRRPERYLVSSVMALPFADKSFDIVLDVGCLHMLSDNEEIGVALGEIGRTLKPGGKYIGRIFKPRPDAWLSVQPFRRSRFGLTESDILSLFSGTLRPRILKSTPHITYLKASR